MLTVRNSSEAQGIKSSDKEDKVQVGEHTMASSVEEKGAQYTSNGREESSEEQGELRAVHNVSTSIQKYAHEAMDMLRSEKLRLKEECQILKEFVRKIMVYGGDNYHQIIERGDLTSLQQRVQEILKPSEDTTQRQNISGARFNAQKDTATDQSDSHVSNQPNKWEHLGARPKDRPPESDRCPKPSLLNSKQVAEPVAHGVANAVLARHSEDKHLHESLYYNKEEEMLAKNFDSMMNMIDSDKAEPYLCDYQVDAMSDPYYQPYSLESPPLIEVNIRAVGEDGFPLDDKFNSNSVLPPGPSSSYIGANTSQNSYFKSFNPDLGSDFALDTSKPQCLLDGHLTSLQRSEQGVEEACAMVGIVPREREEREEFDQEIERRERKIRAERARKEKEREARELEVARGWPQQQEPVTGQSLWLCEHYQRHCRVRFPCCNSFYSCHHCHNNSKECDNKKARASHATHLKCSYCHYEQEIGKDSAKCCKCGREMSAYFCAICKHFISIIKNPYHCEKCGICRLYKDKLFHCDVCNVCFHKDYQGNHKCRPDSGHDECGICLEDVFFRGFAIFPCSHKVHRDCAEAVIQWRFDTCLVCRDPYRERLSSRNPFCSIL